MAARDINAWVPVEYDPTLTTNGVQPQALAAVARRVGMGSDTKEISRLLGADVNGGSALTEDTHDGDKVTMYSYQFNGKVTLDEADVEDVNVDAIAGYNSEWLNGYNVSVDNAAFGVSGARSSTASDFRPYNSVNAVLRTSDSGAGYTANANVISGAMSYTNLSGVLGLVEDSNFGDIGSLVVVAHRGLRSALRLVLDDNHRPIFQDGARVEDDTLFGLPITWTAGAIESTSFKRTIVGPKLLIVANRNFLVNGVRVEPQARLIPADINTNALEHTAQYRARKGFVLTVPQAAGMLRVTA